MFDAVAELTNFNFEEIYKLPIVEFLNYNVYIRRKNKELNDKAKKMYAR